MKSIKLAAFASLLLCLSTATRAEIIDFVDLIENGGYGESGWTTLSLSYSGFSVDITGDKNGADAFAYLDWNHAGLGVCGSIDAGKYDKKRPGNGGNICNPGSDDNVTTGESLTFSFSTAVTIDKIWFNNTHDIDKNIDAGDLVTINGTDYAGPGNGYATGNPYNNIIGWR